ncbi:hypothetical protein Tco_0726063 [Tanacetum coccineum]|uniref:Reverse transcriptase domain-containing protein n=1 Tax=Tanacetum coccineum TaxID=301880 RepID=A0ABQ4YH30_9ASTR
MSSRTLPASRHLPSLLKSLKSLCSSSGTPLRKSQAQTPMSFILLTRSAWVQMMSLLLPSSLILVTKCLSGKSTSNDRLRKSRIDILWGKGSQGKKIADTPKEIVEVSEESDPEPAKRQIGSRSTRSVESKKISRRQPNTRGSSEGTVSKIRVPGESTVVFSPSSEGTENESDYCEVDQGNDENIPWESTIEDEEKKDDDDADDDKSIDFKKTDDEETDDEFVHSKECAQEDDEETDDEVIHGDKKVNETEDEEMIDAKVAEYESEKGDEGISDTTKADAKKTEEVKDDIKKAEFPPSSSSLSVSLGFGNQFLNLSSDKSTDGNLKDTAYAEINSLSQVTVVVNEYLGSSLGDTLHKVLQKHTSALIQQQSKKQSINQEQEPTKITSEILKVKKEQADKQKMTKYIIKSTDKTALNEPYGDEDEDNSARPNQGKKTKRRRTKESESSKKTSTTKETSRCKASTKGSKAKRSVTVEETCLPQIDNAPRMRTRSAGGPAAKSKEGNSERVWTNSGALLLDDHVAQQLQKLLLQDSSGCSYKEFLACNPKEYDGKGGAVVLTCWIEKMENVQDMSGCSNDQKVENTCVFMMIQEFCPSHEMQKLESELWNHAMVGAGHAAYTDMFHELARLVPHLVTPESRMIERYVYGLAP